MSKYSKFSWQDAAVGAIVCALLLIAFAMHWADPLEMKLYDMRAKMRANAHAGDAVVVVGIDDKSIRDIGRWPWPRTYVAEMLDQLSDAGAKVIGLDILFSDPELNPGLKEIRGIEHAYSTDPKAKQFVTVLNDAEKRLDNDTHLADSIALAQNVVLPMYFVEGESMGKNTKSVPAQVEKNFAANLKSDGNVTATQDFVAPYENFANPAKAIGTINLAAGSDGVERAVPLMVDYNGRLFPSFALQCLRAYYNLESDDYRYYPAKELVLGRTHIPVDQNGRMLVNYVDSTTIPHVYFSDVRNKQVPMELFKDKIVLIGMMATGGGDLHATPVANQMPGVEIQANVINGILSNSYIVRPAWAANAEWGAMVLIALFVCLAIPMFSAGRSAVVGVILLAAIIGSSIYAFSAYGYWLKGLYPCLMLVAGYTVVVSKRYLVSEKTTEKLEGESAETNKMLGLSFQGQGMLDMAFDKFRKVPLDDSMKDVLYNLALDFERKRQFNKAVSVFEHISNVDAKYRDIRARMEKLKVAGETMVFGGGLGKKAAEGTVMLDKNAADFAKPTLGRYEVVKELGKGAMGTVYLGKDPKINREVAIKTLRFEDEFDAADQAIMKERFFREAESAGRLVHPNIVTIYDAGDDGDISYIAMELLNGRDLKDYTSKATLLSIPEVIDIVARVSDALDYAHAQGVVHRDIKPANIMRLNDGTIKVTDFGIARITSQSKTATGTVMGTPSYMAPEQLAGKKVDGRADLFSLGVMLYEMLTAEKPFIGESVATLMFRIANEPHENIMKVRQDLPPAIAAVIDRALEKDPEKRFARGSEMAAALRAAGAPRAAAAKA